MTIILERWFLVGIGIFLLSTISVICITCLIRSVWMGWYRKKALEYEYKSKELRYQLDEKLYILNKEINKAKSRSKE